MKKLIFLILSCFSLTAFAKNSSIYTDLDVSKCKVTVLNQEEAYSEQVCKGVAEFTLKVLDGDDRQSITIVAPELQEFPLNYWHVVTRSFSTLGKKAEWRMESGDIPVALIVRVNAEEDGKIRSYLTVSKISDEVCVVAKVKPQKRQNELAREIADKAASMPCLPELN